MPGDLLDNSLKTFIISISSVVPAQKRGLNSEVMGASCAGGVTYKGAFLLRELLRVTAVLSRDLGSHSVAVNTFTKKPSRSSCVVTLFLHSHFGVNAQVWRAEAFQSVCQGTFHYFLSQLC